MLEGQPDPWRILHLNKAPQKHPRCYDSEKVKRRKVKEGQKKQEKKMTESEKVQRKARNRMRISLKIKVAVFCFVLLSRTQGLESPILKGEQRRQYWVTVVPGKDRRMDILVGKD